MCPALLRAAIIAGLSAIVLASTAAAVDGVIEINQVKALAGGVTATDTPGFPVTLDAKGSYVLTGNLLVGTTGISAIEVAADEVSVDLNGFLIEGPVTCTGFKSTVSCSPTSPVGYGVEGVPFASPPSNTEIKNGTVRGFPAGGIRVGDICQVEGVRVLNNGNGISGKDSCTVIDNIVRVNDGIGIALVNYCVVRGNFVTGNDGAGISCQVGAVMIENNVESNDGLGLNLVGGLVSHNVSNRNLTGISALEGLTAIGNSANYNSGHGIVDGNGLSLIVNNNAIGNTIYGIWVGKESVINENNATGNGDHGIRTPGSSGVRGNTASGNGGDGMNLGATTGYADNVVDGNTTGTVTGGFQIGTNGCNGNTTCP